MTRWRGRPPSQRVSTIWREERGGEVLVRKNIGPSRLGHHDHTALRRDYKGKPQGSVALCLSLRRDSWSISKGLTSKTGLLLSKMSLKAAHRSGPVGM